MLSIQGRFGADVLAYSETLDAVSLTSTSTETLRGLGYWLFYVRDPFGFTTTSSVDYMALRPGDRRRLRPPRGLPARAGDRAAGRTALRRAAGLRRHRAGRRRAPDRRPGAADDAARASLGLSLALRSSTRAIPLSTFGLALGAGALVSAAGALRWRWRALGAGRRSPPLACSTCRRCGTAAFVDPALDPRPGPAGGVARGRRGARRRRPRRPRAAAARPGVRRVPLGLHRRPAAARSDRQAARHARPAAARQPGAMDLLYALDDRFQTSTIEPAAIAPVARLLGADTIWLTNDVAFERFRTARPEPVADAVRRRRARRRAGHVVRRRRCRTCRCCRWSTRPRCRRPGVGEPLPPVQLADVQDAPRDRARRRPARSCCRAAATASSTRPRAGLLTGDEAVLYAADVRARRRPVDGRAGGGHRHQPRPGPPVARLAGRHRVHRGRRPRRRAAAHRRRRRAPAGVPRRDRLPTRPPRTLESGLVVRATGYGEPFAYRPEERPAMAVDGDPATAWVVGDRADPVGERLEVSRHRRAADAAAAAGHGGRPDDHRRCASPRSTARRAAVDVDARRVVRSPRPDSAIDGLAHGRGEHHDHGGRARGPAAPTPAVGGRLRRARPRRQPRGRRRADRRARPGSTRPRPCRSSSPASAPIRSTGGAAIRSRRSSAG